MNFKDKHEIEFDSAESLFREVYSERRKRIPPPPPPPQPPLAWLLPIIILKVLRESPLHGYQIASELEGMLEREIPRPMIYVTLRRMEEQDLVKSKWEIPEKGPARRIYYITEEGLEFLERAVKEISALIKFLSRIAKGDARERGDNCRGFS